MTIAPYTTTLWDATRGKPDFGSLIGALKESDHDLLAEVAANTILNNWCSDVADDEGDKRLPYIGWYWRSVDFARHRITVGDCGEFIGFMENNKWGYPERDLTPDEADHVIGLLWRARDEGNAGGLLSNALATRDATLRELWDWMQGLTGLDDFR